MHLARAAFAEKGVFLKGVHQYVNGDAGYEDDPLRPRCDAGSCYLLDAGIMASTLTAAGPINWQQGAPDAPEFRGFVVPGTRFENKGASTSVGHLDLSTSPSFPAGANTISQEIDVDTNTEIHPNTNTGHQINCSPLGFFHATVPAATYNALSDAAVAAASASGGEPRIYYRLRECFTNGSCVNTTSVVPAYTVIVPTGSTGCTITCAVGAPHHGRTGPVAALLAALAGLVLFGSRREPRRRRRRREKKRCATS